MDNEAATVDPIEAGRAALASGAWEQARGFFESAAAQTPGPEAFEGLSWAAWWCSDAEVVFGSPTILTYAANTAAEAGLTNVETVEADGQALGGR